MIKAIETRWRGWRFRSRTEARWAVFFDALGLKWDYEPEGFDLGPDGLYLPDFWLPNLYDRALKPGMWVEVKGQKPTWEEQKKLDRVVTHTGRSGLMVVGQPAGLDFGLPPETWTQHTVYGDEDIGTDSPMQFQRCQGCRIVKVEFPNDYNTCPRCRQESCVATDPLIQGAVEVARAARFEHGERP